MNKELIIGLAQRAIVKKRIVTVKKAGINRITELVPVEEKSETQAVLNRITELVPVEENIVLAKKEV